MKQNKEVVVDVTLQGKYITILSIIFPFTISNRISVCMHMKIFQLFVGSSCLIYVICVCLRIVVSNTYYVVFFFVLCAMCCQFL